MKKLLIALCASAVLAGGCTQIDENERGVRKYYGAMEERTIGPGMEWYNPWSTDIEVLNAAQEKVDVDTAAYTKDAQQAVVKGTVTFRINPSKAHIVYRQAGNSDWANTLPLPALIASVIKNEFGKNNAMGILANRNAVSGNIESALRNELAKRHIILDAFNMVNLDYSDAFESAVEAKEVAVQDAIREKNKTVAVQERATQAVVTAKGEAEAMSVRANALAQNPKLVEYEAVQKWNGVLPQYQMGGTTPFVNVTPR